MSFSLKDFFILTSFFIFVLILTLGSFGFGMNYIMKECDFSAVSTTGLASCQISVSQF
ncbi:MAG: hypothetical protein WCJ84_05530 [Candidatus Peregrinibacteria bacterium]